MSDWPRQYRPLDQDGRPHPDRALVELFQHRPGNTDDLVAWTDGVRITVNGAAAIVLPGKGGVVGLGDFALKYPGGRVIVQHADGLATRYQPVEQP